jgi:hypothetical protein
VSLVYQHDTRPVIKLRECGTRKTYTVYVSKETDTLYVGDAIGDIVCDHRAFAKSRYEVVTEQSKSEQIKQEWLSPIAIAGALGLLVALIACIVNALAR